MSAAPIGAWCGRAALGCALGVAAFALTAQRLFLHLGLPAAPAPATVAGAAAAGALTLAGVLLAIRALRRGARPGSGAAGAALVLLAPFVADALLALPGPRLEAGPRRALFLALTEGLAVAAVAAAWRARRRGPARAPRVPRVAGRRLATRAAFALLALAASLGTAELLLRALDVGARNFAAPMIIVPGDERRLPLSEIALFVPVGPPGPGNLSARFRPYCFFKGWYDRPRWSYFNADGQVDYVFNRWGLRDEDFERDKPAGELRVIAIGDSFTMGAGVPLEDTWPKVLQHDLQQQLGRPVDVINAGFAAGNDPVSYDPWLCADGLSLHPDIVVVGLCLNDMDRRVEMAAYKSAVPPRQLFGGRSNLLNSLQQSLLPAAPPRRRLDFTELVQREPQSWQRTQAALRHTHEVLAARGVRFVVAPFPMLSGLRDTPYPYAGLLKLVSDCCAQAGIETVDVTSRFLGRVDEDLWVHWTDQHPNDVAQRLIAEAIEEGLALK